MGRRNRQRSRERLQAPTSEYRDPDGNVLVLRGALTPATRREYAEVRSGEALRPGAAREDAWHRAVELLFERLAVSWTVAGVRTERQKDLLQRFRVASASERAWIRSVLREHLAEHFPDVEAP